MASPIKLDKRAQDVLFAEVGGGSPEELAAVASVLINRIQTLGVEKALKGFSSYTKSSPQYTKAQTLDLNPYERKMYDRNNLVLNAIAQDPTKALPYTHFENVNAYGTPTWAQGQTGRDIGRQRFYTLPLR